MPSWGATVWSPAQTRWFFALRYAFSSTRHSSRRRRDEQGVKQFFFWPTPQIPLLSSNIQFIDCQKILTIEFW